MSSTMHALIALIAAGSIALDAFVVVAVGMLLFGGRRRLMALRPYALMGILVLSVLSIAGTLLMQYAGALPPCVLCWWQRVFMYPIAFVSLVAFFKNTDSSDVSDYVLALSIPGILVALYQHGLQVLPQGTLIPCDAANECAVRSVFEFGFVTIPWMAVSAFAAIMVIAWIGRSRA